MTTTQTISYQEATAFVLPFDKFQGKTMAQAYAADPAYVRWLAQQMAPRNDTGRTIKAMAAAYLAGSSQPKTNGQTPAKPATNGNGKAATKPAPAQARTNGHGKPAPAKSNGNAQKNDGEHPRIFSIMTNKAFFHVEDALGIGKIKFFMGSYVKGQGSKATVIHYVDVADARVIAFDLAVRGSLSTKFVDYKGSPKGMNGQPLSRVLKIEDRGNEAKRPIVIEAANGPGEITGQGAIKPAGKPTSQVVIFLTRHEARKLGHTLQSYLQAWETARMTLTPPETISEG